MMSGLLPCNGSHRVLLQQHEWPWNLTKKSGEPKKHLLCTWKTNPKKRFHVTAMLRDTHQKNILLGSKEYD